MALVVPSSILCLILTAVQVVSSDHLDNDSLDYYKAESSLPARERSCGYQPQDLNTTWVCTHWKYHQDHNTSCRCGDNIHGTVKCSNDTATIGVLSCHCMTYSENGEDVVVGACPYLCTNDFYLYIEGDANMSSICDRVIHQNRQGQMCGQCLDNHSPSPYSYTLACAHCSDYKYNWIKYLLMAYLPLTVFYITVVFFRFNALSPSMNAFIFVCQVSSCQELMSLFITFANFSEEHPVLRKLNFITITKSLGTFYSMWNLDFFRMAYSPFCLHPSLSIIQIKCLEYAIAVYPLLLVLLTYAIIKLYEMLKLVQFLLKPVVWVLTRFDRRWNTSNSLIEAFATFILLSYVKIVNTSFDILMPVDVHNVSGKTVGQYVFYNGSMEYFGKEHLPYGILALFMFTTFNLVPLLLLCLYPCRCFQSCLNCCRLNSQVLRTFMDAFQGCYKFEPYDCRYWAAFYLLLRILFLVVFALTLSGYLTLGACASEGYSSWSVCLSVCLSRLSMFQHGTRSYIYCTYMFYMINATFDMCGT